MASPIKINCKSPCHCHCEENTQLQEGDVGHNNQFKERAIQLNELMKTMPVQWEIRKQDIKNSVKGRNILDRNQLFKT